jgi:hypothetical protein
MTAQVTTAEVITAQVIQLADYRVANRRTRKSRPGSKSLAGSKPTSGSTCEIVSLFRDVTRQAGRPRQRPQRVRID